LPVRVWRLKVRVLGQVQGLQQDGGGQQQGHQQQQVQTWELPWLLMDLELGRWQDLGLVLQLRGIACLREQMRLQVQLQGHVLRLMGLVLEHLLGQVQELLPKDDDQQQGHQQQQVRT